MAFAVVMVRAVHIGIKRQRTVQESLHCLIGIALHTADQTDIGLRKRCLCAAANAAADQRIHTELCQQAGQRTVTAAVRIHHLRCNSLPPDTSYSLNCSVWPKCWKTSPFS